MDNRTIRADDFRLYIMPRADGLDKMNQNAELIYVLNGEIDAVVEEKISYLKRDDILVINANRRHRLCGGDGVLAIRLDISSKMLSTIYESGVILFLCDSSLSRGSDYDRLRAALRRLTAAWLSRSREAWSAGELFEYVSRCCEVMNILTLFFRIGADKVKAPEESRKEAEVRLHDRLVMIENYIYDNYQDDISLKDLSEQLYLSTGYLARFFRKNYGCTFADYLTQVRLFHAVDELIYTDKSLTYIAYDKGFRNSALFNRAFKKKYGMLPSQFRERYWQKLSDEDDAERSRLYTEQLEKLARSGELEEEAPEGSGTAVHRVIAPAGAAEPLKNSWGRLINLGAAEDLMMDSTVRQHMVIMHEGLGFTYGRVWRLFSEKMHINPESGEEGFNFTRVDSVIDMILQQGMIPYLELGMKPKRLNFDLHSGNTIEFGEQHIIYDPEYWERLIGEFMRHLLSRYEEEEISRWYMELWFDPQLLNNSTAVERYLETYEAVSRVVRSFHTGLRLGGCGMIMNRGIEKIGEFLDRFANGEEKPDFLSFEFFAYDVTPHLMDEYITRSTDEQAFFNRMEDARRLMDEAGQAELPLIVTEWGLTPSVRNRINDTAFMGAYIVRNILETYGLAYMMGYFTSSDIPAMYYDTKDPLFGGNGLITHDSIMKPAAFGIEFLNRLYGNILCRDGTCIVTADGYDSYCIVAHNQQTLGAQYYLTPEDALDREHVWKYFETEKKKKLTVRIEGAADGDYIVKYYIVSEQYGSVFDAWREMGFMEELTRNDIKYLRRVCEPHMTVKMAQAEAGVLTVEREMEPNEIVCIRIHIKR